MVVIFCSHVEEGDIIIGVFTCLLSDASACFFKQSSPVCFVSHPACLLCLNDHQKHYFMIICRSVRKSVHTLSSSCLPYWWRTLINPCNIHIYNTYIFIMKQTLKTSMVEKKKHLTALFLFSTRGHDYIEKIFRWILIWSQLNRG